MNLFDTHCHLDLAAFDADRDSVLKSARDAGVSRLLIPATKEKGWLPLLHFCAQDSQLYPALGLHPMLLPQHHEQDLQALDDFVSNQPTIAIGEIGLDYWQKDLDKEKQQFFFEAQLKIAEQHQLPVVLHVRKAHDNVLQTLKKYNLKGGFCHAFNGSEQQASQYLSMNFKLGFGGMLTYPNANKLRKLAKSLPLEALVLETDAPDMTGLAHQYQRNSPAYLPEVLSVLAELKGITENKIAEQTTGNALQTLGLD